MKQPLVSVIVPIYNAEAYLTKCVDSILHQTYKNIELILVDDGSTDMSPNICDEYALKYRLIRVVHKNNGGQSDARNCGLKVASGDYIMFVDADDYIESSAVDTLVNASIKTKAEIVQMKSFIVSEDYSIRLNQSSNTNEIEILSAERYISKMCNKVRSDSVCDKLFFKTLFSNHQFTTRRLNEDFLFLSTLLMNNPSISIADIDYTGYYYFQRSGSTSHSGCSQALVDSISNGAYLAKKALEQLPVLEIAFKQYSLYQARSFFVLVPWTTVFNKEANYREVLQCVKSMRTDIKKTGLSFFNKILLSFVGFIPILGISFLKISYSLKKLLKK